MDINTTSDINDNIDNMVLYNVEKIDSMHDFILDDYIKRAMNSWLL